MDLREDLAAEDEAEGGARAGAAEGGAAAEAEMLRELMAAARADDVQVAARCLALAPRTATQPLSAAAVAAAAAVADGKDVEAEGRTALHCAAEAGSAAVLELLLQNGAVVEAEDARGKTPLKVLAEAGAHACLSQLLKRGANISHADAAGQTPMQCAMERRHEEMQAAMLAYKLEQDEKLLGQMNFDAQEHGR